VLKLHEEDQMGRKLGGAVLAIREVLSKRTVQKAVILACR
jgi:hypothetical protein